MTANKAGRQGSECQNTSWARCPSDPSEPDLILARHSPTEEMTSNPILAYSVLLVPPSFLGEQRIQAPVPDLAEDFCLPLGLAGTQHQVKAVYS